MATNVADLVATLRMDTAQFTRGANAAGQSIDRVAASADRTQSAIGRWAGAMKVAAVAALGLFAKQAIGAAVAAEEAGSAFATTFGPATKQAAAFVEDFANKAGFANYQLEQMMAVTGNVVQGLGATEQASLQLTERMVTLAGDVASFSNAQGGAQAVMLALQSAINGEREALKTYGLAVSEAEVQTKAFEMTGKANASELTRMDKALATVEVAYGKASKAIGDLDRTQDSHANTIRRVQAGYEELKVTVGESLLPVMDSLLPATENLMSAFGNLVGLLDKIPGLVAAAGAGLTALALGLGPVGVAVSAVVGLGLALGGGPVGQLKEFGQAVDLFKLALRGSESALPDYADQLRDLGDAGEALAPQLEDVYWTMTRMREAIVGTFGFLNQGSRLALQAITSLDEYGDLSIAGSAKKAEIAWLEVFNRGMFEDAMNRLDIPEMLDRGVVRPVDNAFELAFKQAKAETLKGFDGIDKAFTEWELPDISLTDMITNLADWQAAQDEVAAMLDALGDHGLDAFASALMEGLSPQQLAAIAAVWGGDLSALYALLPVYGPGGALHPGGSNPPIEGQAAGGPVSANTPYVVGERGPELFVPNSAGTIIPNNRLDATDGSRMAAAGVTVNIGTALGDDIGIERMVTTAIRRARLRGEWHG